ncbi:MAG: hypothetical protein ACOC35_11140 [Promethearchaeia archaeon]
MENAEIPEKNQKYLSNEDFGNPYDGLTLTLESLFYALKLMGQRGDSE